MISREMFKQAIGGEPSVIFNGFCFETDKIALAGSLVDGRYYIARRDERNKALIWRWSIYPTVDTYREGLREHRILIKEMIG